MAQKTVLVTGCSAGGLGEAMAKTYHNKGFKVFATIRNKAKLGSLREIADIEIIDLEITSSESMRRCADLVGKHTGGTLDILVNNAGTSDVRPLLDTPLEDAKHMYDTNVWSILGMAQAFAPLLIKAKGAMCNISSVSGELNFAWQGLYSSSRGATTRISEALRLEMAPLGVRVVTVVMGGVSTSGNDANTIPDLELPPDSYYQKIYSTLNHHKKLLIFPDKENVEVTANSIVGDVLSGNGTLLRRGAGSYSSLILNAILPYSWVTWMINNKSGLGDL